MIGTTLGHYEILAKLGEGGMGAVWKARHTLLPDRIVALKLLSPNLWGSEEARQRFLREAMAVSKLDHPRIATLHDAEQIEGNLQIAFKYIDGDTVARRTAAGPLPLADAVSVTADAAEALAHAHARGVLHRDVTGGNIMIDREGHGVLVDFGLARSATDATLTRTGTTQGTIAYMAPEVVRSEEADPRSDLYGLGIVLYRMVTGRLPFEAQGEEALLFKVLNEEPRPPSSLRPGIPPDLDDVILRLLEKDPADRFQDASQLLDELRRIRQLPAIEADATTVAEGSRGPRAWLRAWQRTLRRRGARRGLLIGAAAGLVALAALGAWLAGWRPGFMTRVPTVAVLPARNASEDLQETAFLAEGFGEEMVSRLSQVSGLHLVSWLSSQRYADPSVSVQKVARELRADLLLVNSYRSDGERLRVTATLVEGKSGHHRWSQTFEENVEDLFTIQREISVGVASRLKRAIAAPERERLVAAPSGSPDAYELYLRGSSLLHAGGPEAMAQAELLFKRALELDPGLAQACVGLGAIYSTQVFLGLDPSERAVGLAEQHYRKALELEPELISARRGLLRLGLYRGEAEECLELARAAVRSPAPSLEELLLIGEAYTYAQLPEKAIAPLERAIALDEANPAAHWHLVIAADWAGQHEKAYKAGATYLRRFGEDEAVEVYIWMADAALEMGTPDSAGVLLERARAIGGINRRADYYAAVVYLSSGSVGRARQILSQTADSLERRLEGYPDNVGDRVLLATTQAFLERDADVVKQLKILMPAIESPGYRNVWIADLALALLYAGMDAQAERIFQIMRKDEAAVVGYAGEISMGWFYARLDRAANHPLTRDFLAYAAPKRARLRAKY